MLASLLFDLCLQLANSLLIVPQLPFRDDQLFGQLVDRGPLGIFAFIFIRFPVQPKRQSLFAESFLVLPLPSRVLDLGAHKAGPASLGSPWLFPTHELVLVDRLELAASPARPRGLLAHFVSPGSCGSG